MAAGASPSLGDDVLVVVDSGYDRRYFYSANTAARGLGFMGNGEVKVYRLDEEASSDLTRGVKTGLQIAKHDPKTGKWTKSTLENLKGIITTLTGIRRI